MKHQIILFEYEFVAYFFGMVFSFEKKKKKSIYK